MNRSKIKKHFSLFMVEKSIRKKFQQSKKKELIQSINLRIPHQIDPINSYRIYGDIIFIDKPYTHPNEDSEIGLVALYNSVKIIKEINHNRELKFWVVKLDDIKGSLDPIDLLCSRLESLGNNDAKIVADDLIKYNKMILQNQSNIECDNYPISEIDYLEIYKEYKDLYYISFRFEYDNNMKCLILKEHRYSDQMIEFLFENEYEFCNYFIDFGLFDYFSVNYLDYFYFLHLNIDSISKQEKLSMKLNLNTFDGHKILVEPVSKNHYFFNNNGQLTNFTLFYAFDTNEIQVNNVLKKREKKSIPRKKKSIGDENLEDLLGFYYNKNCNSDNKKSNTKSEEENSSKKRCLYRDINFY